MLYDKPFLDEIRGHTLVLGIDDETTALRTLARQAQKQDLGVFVLTTPETDDAWRPRGMKAPTVASNPEEVATVIRILHARLDDPSPRDYEIILIVSSPELLPDSHELMRRFFLQKPKWLRGIVVSTRQWPLPGVLADHAGEFTSRIVTGQNMDVLRDVVGFSTPAPPCWDDWSVQSRPGGSVKTITTPNVVYPRPGEIY